MTFLDAAQVAQLARFLSSPRDECDRRHLDPYTFEWATGERPYPNITAWRFPG